MASARHAGRVFVRSGGSFVLYNQLPPQPFTLVNRPRQTWAFGSAGVGLDIGLAFIQLKLENRVASQGPIVVPLNVGFRFRD